MKNDFSIPATREEIEDIKMFGPFCLTKSAEKCVYDPGDENLYSGRFVLPNARVLVMKEQNLDAAEPTVMLFFLKCGELEGKSELLWDDESVKEFRNLAGLNNEPVMFGYGESRNLLYSQHPAVVVKPVTVEQAIAAVNLLSEKPPTPHFDSIAADPIVTYGLTFLDPDEILASDPKDDVVPAHSEFSV